MVQAMAHGPANTIAPYRNSLQSSKSGMAPDLPRRSWVSETIPNKLVVITDGAKQMKLVAFWRNSIPPGASFRIAGQIPVTCGFSPLPEWIQSEQSVVVYGYGAFVVNNIPQSVSSDIQSATKILQVSLHLGPAYPTSYGAQRFQWEPQSHSWSSVWAKIRCFINEHDSRAQSTEQYGFYKRVCTFRRLGGARS